MLVWIFSGCFFGGNGVPDSTLLADLDADQVSSICEDFESRTMELECDGEVFELFPSVVASCRSGLPDLTSDCGLTAGHLEDCVDQIEQATCGADFFEGACEPFFDESCQPLDAIVMELAGGQLSGSLVLDDLSLAQFRVLCEELSFDPYTLECPDFTLESEGLSVDTCMDEIVPLASGCGATVDMVVDCYDSVLADPCSDDLSACASWFSCL